jgi:hypothetical protein
MMPANFFGGHTLKSNDWSGTDKMSRHKKQEEQIKLIRESDQLIPSLSQSYDLLVATQPL